VAIECPKCQTKNPDNQSFCGDCATPLPDAKKAVHTKTIETPKEELTRGSTFAGRYEIIEELGKGGMGKVYRVEDTKAKEEIALKLIKPEIAADKKTIERFRHELTTARKISHRNVCRMFDLGEDEGTHFITMEYVQGEDLKSFIKRAGPLGTGRAISITKQVCEGLSEAHRLGIIHRDLKPNNIMIDKEGNAKIMDFGIARSLRGKGITGARVMIGTPEYMSPEQVEAKDVDQRSDIYSLGIILYEMTTGRLPFEADTPFAVGVKQKSEKPESPKDINPQIPDDLNQVILKCLEKEKENRCQSAGEVQSELENIEKGIPTTEKEKIKKKPLTSKEITVTFGIKKLFIPALVIIGLIIISIIAWQLLFKQKGVSVSSDKPTLAIMYFKNNTGDESLDNLRSALSDLLITDLSQSRYIRVLTADRIFEILDQLNLQEVRSYSSDDLKKVATRGGATHILQGNFIKLGETFRIDIDLKESKTMDSIGTEKTEGIGEESIFTMVDDLTRRIKANFRLSEETIAGDIDKDVTAITTSSPEAYKYYVEGRKYHSQGDFHKSIELMEKAITIDPEFAMAYRSMGASHWSLYNTTISIEYSKKAFELSDRLPDREKYLIQGNHNKNSEKTWDKAIDAYKKLLELYPEDWIGMSSLGLLYNNLGEKDKAIKLFERSIQLNNNAYQIYSNLASLYRSKGFFDKSQKVLEGYLKDIDDNAAGRYQLARHFFLKGEFDRALAETKRSLSLNPSYFRNFWTRGDIYIYKGDYSQAEKEYCKLLELDEKSTQIIGLDRLAYLNLFHGRFERAIDLTHDVIELAEISEDERQILGGHRDLSDLYLRSRRPEKAMEECEIAWALAVEQDNVQEQRNALYWKSLVYLAMGLTEDALRTADELKKLIDESMNKKLISNYYSLMGWIELQRGQYSQAIDFFIKIPPLISVVSNWHIDIANSLGTAYLKAGNLEKAQEEFEKIISFILGRQWYGDIYVKAFYMLGQIYEQQGDSARAIEHYEKFLNLWKNADPGLPELEDAKQRLAGLKQ